MNLLNRNRLTKIGFKKETEKLQLPKGEAGRRIKSIYPCMWNLKRHYTNKLIYKTETDSQPQRTNLWLLGGRMGEGIVREFGIDMYMLLYLKWITNKDRGLCSMLCGYQYIFLQRRHTAGQKAHEKMLNITNYQRNVNQNCIPTSYQSEQP